ncbi:MAG: PqqD family protein [Endomicrobiales bacterium]|nr:PqqD family protein [Endomicrobiales bacterium]
MRIKKAPSIAWRKIEGRAFVIEAATSTLHELNEPGTFLWEMINKGTDIEEMVKRTVREYSICDRTARKDIMNFVDRLSKAGMIENKRQ